MTRRHLDAEGHRRTTGETIVLLKINGLVGQFLHIEGPEEAGDGEEDLLFGKRDSGADAATVVTERLAFVRKKRA